MKNIKTRLPSLSTRYLTYIATVLGVALLVFLFYNVQLHLIHPFHSVEVAFTDSSLNSKLSIVPASCPSSPDYAGECGEVSKVPVWTYYCTGGSDINGNNWQWWQYDNSTPTNYALVRAGDGACDAHYVVPLVPPVPLIPVVSVLPKSPEVRRFLVNPAPIRESQGATVEWEVINATNCSVRSNNGDYWTGLSGSGISKPIQSQTIFTLTCGPRPGVIVTVVVSVLPKSPEVRRFLAHPALIRRGQGATVEWEVINAVSCSVTSNNGDYWTGLSGSGISKPIQSQTIFTLACVPREGAVDTNYHVFIWQDLTRTVNVSPQFRQP